MIKVNLLPQEYRKTEATPAKQFLSTIGAVLLALASLVVWIFQVQKLDNRQTELNSLEEKIANQKNALDLSKKLGDALKEYKSRYDKIDEVANNRIVLSRKFDELWEILVNPRVPNRYEIWLRSLSCTVAAQGGAGSRAKKAVGGITQFAGTSAGTRIARYADFHDDLTQSEFFKDYNDITPPYGSREELDGDREPKEGWNFTLSLSLKPLKELYADRDVAAGKAAPEAPKKPAK
jgi:Tfp pilus assembly protein PilN